ncbi:MAG: hypothetical protein WBC37_17320 [Burkholderiaceae bacterium]
MLVPWTPLTPSRCERAVRRTGVFLAVATSATLLVAAARDEAFDAFLVAVAVLALLAGAVAGRSRPPARLEVGVDRSGALAVRRADDAESVPEHGLQCVFAAPWLITLRRGTILIPIWPDSVPGNTYRRLWVHIRWGSGRQPADLPAGIAPGQPE